MRHFRRLTALLLILCAPPALAASVAGVAVPDTFAVEGTTLRLNGAGLRTLTIFEVSVYVAALYVSEPSHDVNAIMAEPGPKAIVLHFLHDASKAQIEAEFRKGEQQNCGGGGCSQTELPDFQRLMAASPAVKVGDTSTYIYYPDHVRVLANGRSIGDFADAPLSRQLLAGFIGEHPPSEALKRALLGSK